MFKSSCFGSLPLHNTIKLKAFVFVGLKKAFEMHVAPQIFSMAVVVDQWSSSSLVVVTRWSPSGHQVVYL